MLRALFLSDGNRCSAWPKTPVDTRIIKQKLTWRVTVIYFRFYDNMTNCNFRNRSPGEAKPRTNKQYADDAHCRSTFVLFSHFNRLKISFVVGAHSKPPTGAPAGGAEEAGSAAAWLRAPLHCPGRLRAETQHTPFKDLLRYFLSNPPMMESLHGFLIIPLFLEHFEAKSFFTSFSVKLKRSLIYHSMRTCNKIMTAQILIVQVHTQKLSN